MNNENAILNPAELGQPTTKRDALIAQLSNKSVRLSYSSLKKFTTPVDFLNYKLKPKASNAGMDFGKICDTLILTPDELETKYQVVDKMPTTDLQVNFASALVEVGKITELTPELIEAEFKRFYSRGDAGKTYEELRGFVSAKIKGLEIVTPALLAEAQDISGNLLISSEAEPWLSQISDVQKRLEWNENGWNFLGFMDALLGNNIGELKYTKDANPEKFEREIANFDYYLQAAIYCYASEKLGLTVSPRHYTLIYDKNKNVAVVELDASYINYGFRKYKYLLENLDKCAALGAWDQSYGFFKPSYLVSKPKWAKAFLLDGETNPYDI